MLGPDTKMGFLFKPLLLGGLLLASLALSGCSGDDGSAGTPGRSAYEIAVANGFTGTEAEWLEMVTGTGTPKTAEVETCAVCHNDVAVTHAATGVAAVSGTAVALNGADLDITFNVKLDGVNNDGYGIRTSVRSGVTSATAYVSWADATLIDPALRTNYVRTQFPLTATEWITPAGGGTGNYTITVPAANVIANATYLFRLANPTLTGDTQPVVVATYGTHLRDLVTDAGCANCHGDFPAWSEKFQHYAVGGSKCQVCHSQATRDTTFNTRTSATTFTTAGPILGTNLTEYIHGIHNSHNMPDGTYYRTTAVDGAANIEDRYSLGFPSSMTNCRVCHTTDAQLADVANDPVSYYLCMTCHQNWDGFVHTHDDAAAVPPVVAGSPIMVPGSFLSNLHRPLLPADSCLGAACHSVTTRDEAADFHDDFQGTDAHYNSYYRGEDISFANSDNVTFGVTGVTSNGSAVSFTWTAFKGTPAVAINPCNTDINAGPLFSYLDADGEEAGLGAYLAYAKGDDWVNEFVSTSPGQPVGARKLFGDLTTTCSANVATTTGLTLNASALAYADKVILAIGGKAKDLHAATGNAYFIRETSPTYEFNPATGAPVTPRRNAVDNTKCLGCHQGSLYQHGGDRVDNEQLCVICHNPSSGDKNNRLDKYQIVNADGTVNTAATYDGKNNETFDMRTMIHAIHGVDKRNDPWVLYRGRGIYAFAPDLYEEVILPGDDEVSTVKVAFPKPAGWPAEGVRTINGSTNGSLQTHNWTVVHFPRRVNDCLACHNDEYVRIPDQTQAVPLTVDPGFDYSSQSDDIVIGPAAAACTACHATAPTRVHATVDFGYRANVTKESMLAKAAQ